MTFLVTHIGWLMLVSGILTLTMLQAALAPKSAVRAMFGEALEGPAADRIVRSWGILIGLMGVLLILGSQHPPVRGVALAVAGASKLAFVLLVLSHGKRFLRGLGAAVIIDSIWVALFALYFAGGGR
jgi:hypothetical protein